MVSIIITSAVITGTVTRKMERIAVAHDAGFFRYDQAGERTFFWKNDPVAERFDAK